MEMKGVLFMEFVNVNTLKENDVIKFINPNRTLFDGRVKKISNDFLGIVIYTNQATYMELSKDQSIQLILVYNHKAIKCASIILGSKQNGFEQAIIISIPKIILGIERREFERIPIVMEIDYSPLPDESNYEKLSAVEQRYFRCFRKTYTVDISAGGVNLIILKDDIATNFALLSISLKDENIITLCKKVRTDSMSDNKYNKIAFMYNDIQHYHRQLILDFVSEKSKEINKSEVV